MGDVDVRDLLARKAELDGQFADLEAAALVELVDAKDALRADPDSEEAKQRKTAAVEAVQLFRELTRAGRTVAVGGDAVVSTTAPAETPETPGSEG